VAFCSASQASKIGWSAIPPWDTPVVAFAVRAWGQFDIDFSFYHKRWLLASSDSASFFRTLSLLGWLETLKSSPPCLTRSYKNACHQDFFYSSIAQSCCRKLSQVWFHPSMPALRHRFRGWVPARPMDTYVHIQTHTSHYIVYVTLDCFMDQIRLDCIAWHYTTQHSHYMMLRYIRLDKIWLDLIYSRLH